MAIDTRNKRASAAGILLAFLLQPALPNGAIDSADRLEAAGAYSGIATTPSGINNRNRRASASFVGCPWNLQPPLADSSISGADRCHPVAVYRGIVPSSSPNLNTRDKRASAAHVAVPWRGVGPLADGNLFFIADRQFIAHSYSAILAGSAPVAVALSNSVVGIVSDVIVNRVIAVDAGGPGGDEGYIQLTGSGSGTLLGAVVKVADSSANVELTGVSAVHTITPVSPATSAENVQITGQGAAINVQANVTAVANSDSVIELTGDGSGTTVEPLIIHADVVDGVVSVGTVAASAVSVGTPTQCVVWTLKAPTGAQMTGQQALNLLMLRLGRNTDAEIRAAALAEMQLAQQVLEGGPIKPWFLYVDHTCDAFRTIPGIESALLPLGFLGIDEDLAPTLYYQNPNLTGPNPWEELDHGRLRDMRRLTKGQQAAPPTQFDFVGNYAYFSPIPDAIYSLKVTGAFMDALPLDTGDTNQWLIYAADWLLAATGIQVCVKHTKDFELAQEFRSDYAVAQARVQLEHERRLHTGRQYSLGD